MTAALPAQKTAAHSKIHGIREYVGARMEGVRSVQSLVSQIDAGKLVGLMLTEVSQNPDLLNCTPDSLYLACREAAALGLPFGGTLGYAYLVKYGNQAKLIPGYRGLRYVAETCGVAKHIRADIRYENDEFRRTSGFERTIVHVPADGDRGKPVGAYCVWTYPSDGERDYEYMAAEEIEQIKKRSQGAKSKGSPWNDQAQTVVLEMWKKTVIRRAYKSLPVRTAQQIEVVSNVLRASDEEHTPTPEVIKDAEYTERPTAPQESATATEALADRVDPLPPDEPEEQPEHSEEDMQRFDLLEAINGLEQNDAWKKATSSAQIAHGGVELDALPLDVLEAVYTEAQGR